MTPRLACIAVALTAGLLAAAPRTAGAQFTTLVTPPRHVQPVVDTVADTMVVARPDTVRPTVLSDLKAWVDSAANVLDAAPAAEQQPAAGDTTPPMISSISSLRRDTVRITFGAIPGTLRPVRRPRLSRPAALLPSPVVPPPRSPCTTPSPPFFVLRSPS